MDEELTLIGEYSWLILAAVVAALVVAGAGFYWNRSTDYVGSSAERPFLLSLGPAVAS